ncbi:S-adenosyl-L-methionine-dependent methyltransferase [Xylaria intraflava]|nr:S-adenosyl-L-methionine-dependent methyltransferase [Xylaria intraflava]
MFTVRSCRGRALHSSPLRIVSVDRRSLSTSCLRLARGISPRNTTPKGLEMSILEAHGPTAESLAASNIWTRAASVGTRSRAKKDTSTEESSPGTKRSRAKRGKSAGSSPSGDKTRVNIVSEKLCDDIMSYIGPSLDRHRGCDILEIYPGAGVWSSKLHEYLQPRSHILMEPDAELYSPYLQPLLDKPGTRLIPKSGIIWRELTSILTPEYFPHQVPAEGDGLNRRNDTLLVTANLAFHPRKRYIQFESMTSLLLFQLVNAIRTGNMFQRYGLVRMLIWARNDDVGTFIPNILQRRKRQAIENDLMCEWVHEVCRGEDGPSWFVREDAINRASLINTIKRMQGAGLQLPPDRMPEGFAEALAVVTKKKRRPQPGKDFPTFQRPYLETLAGLQAAEAEGELDENDRRTMDIYRWRATSDNNKLGRLLHMGQELDKLTALYRGGKAKSEEFKAASLAWDELVGEIPRTLADEFVSYKDNLNAFRQEPPLLQWDRRAYEPMIAQTTEFYPNIPCALLDIQPKAPHPLLRQTGPQSNRASDTLDVLTSALMIQSVQPLGPSMDALAPGAADYIMSRWQSHNGPKADFFNIRFAEAVPRMMNARHWEEVLQLWMEWPFRPEFHELVGRTHDEMDEKYDDSAHSGSTGVGGP